MNCYPVLQFHSHKSSQGDLGIAKYLFVRKLLFILLSLPAHFFAEPLQQIQGEKVANFTLRVSKWSECSCGTNGIQYPIEVKCLDDVMATQVDIRFCNGVFVSATYPSSSEPSNMESSRNILNIYRSCVNNSCDEPEQKVRLWKTGVWSRCSLGLKKREVSCVDEHGRQQAEEECVLQTNRPRSEAECRLSVSDCVVGPLSWTNCTPCQSGQYQLGTRPILRPSFNQGAQCPSDLHRVRKCPDPGLLCSNQWTPCFSFSTELPAQKEFNKVGIGYQMRLMDSRSNQLDFTMKDCAQKLLMDVRLCYVNMTQAQICSTWDTSELGSCVKCWKYRWRYSDYEPAISMLNGKFSSPTNCGPHEQRRSAICECLENSETLEWKMQLSSHCEASLGPAEGLVRTGHTDCSNKSVECRFTEWSVWSDCLTMQHVDDSHAKWNGLSFRSRELLPRLNEDYDDSSASRNEKLLCHSRGAVTQARSCWPAFRSVNETVFINTTHDQNPQSTPPECGSTITNCYINITKSNFISLQFQEQSEYHFCETKTVPCEGECVLSEWSAWSDWWTVPLVASRDIFTEKRQRRRERSVLSFGSLHVDDSGEYFVCDGSRIPLINRFKARSKIYENQTMIFRKTNFEFMPVPTSQCEPLPTNSRKVLPDHQMQYEWQEGLQTMNYDWMVAIGKSNISRTFKERRVIEMFKLNKPARQEQCFTMTSQDCVLSDWSQWIITDGGLSRYRKVMTTPWGLGKPCESLEQKNSDVFYWSHSRSETCSVLSLKNCSLCENNSEKSSIHVHLPNIECREKASELKTGEAVDSIYCRGLGLPDISHLCELSRNLEEATPKSLREPSVKENHMSTINTNLWQYEEFREHSEAVASLKKKVQANVWIDWYALAIWDAWSLCKACEVQPGAQRHWGYKYRYRLGVQPFPSDFCKLLSLWKDVEKGRREEDVLLGYKKGVHFDIKYCLFHQSPIFWPAPDVEYFESGSNFDGELFCGEGRVVKKYSTPDLKTCFWKPETHETFLTEVVTLKHECSNGISEPRSSAEMICNDRDNISWPSSFYIPFQYQPDITFDLVLSKGNELHVSTSSTWSTWSDCVDLTFGLCGAGRQYRTRSNIPPYTHSQFTASSSDSKPSLRNQFIEARDCSKECPSRCTFLPGEETPEEIHPLCWSQPQPKIKMELKVSFIQSSDKDDATHCRVSSWSRYPPCTREDTGSRLFHFRTRTPLDPKQYLLAEECRRFRESRGEEFVHVSLCNHTNKGVTVDYVVETPGRCFVQSASQFHLIEPFFFWQKCDCSGENISWGCKTHEESEESLFYGSGSDAFKLPLGLKFFSLSVSVVSLTIFCFSTFIALKIEFMLKNEAYFESQKEKSLISRACRRPETGRSAAMRCLFNTTEIFADRSNQTADSSGTNLSTTA